MVLVSVCAVLAAGCVTADKLMPRIGPIERFVRGLPLGRGPGR